MTTARRVRRIVGSLLFLAALFAPRLAWSATPAIPPALPAPAGDVVNVSTEAQLQAAVSNLRSNQTIVLAPGVYRLTSTLWINKPLQQVSLRGATNNRDDVVLVGPGMTHASFGLTPHGIWVSGVKDIAIANLTIRDVYQDAVFFAPGTVRPFVYNVHFIDAGYSFIRSAADTPGAGANDGIVAQSVFEFTNGVRDPDAVGIDIRGGARWTIANNTFRNIVASSYQLAGPAILASSYATNTVTEGNTFLNCSRGIVYGRSDVPQGDHAGGIIRNNMFYRAQGKPGETAISVNGSPYTQVLNNSVFVSGTYGTPIEYRYDAAHDLLVANNLLDGSIWARDGATGIEKGNVTAATPDFFADVSSGDLHLAATATVAIDRGVDMPSVSIDWDGDARPSGRGWDVGADERVSSASSAAVNKVGTRSASDAATPADWSPAAAAALSMVSARSTSSSSDGPVFIGGRVTAPDPTGVTQGSGVAGVTVTLNGSPSFTVTTDATGIFLFSGLNLGTDYTITPSKADVTFTPTTFLITALSGTITNANFSIAPPPSTVVNTDPNAPPPGGSAPPSGSIFDPAPPDDPNPDPAPADPTPPPTTNPPPPSSGGGTPGPAPIAPPTIALTAPLNGSTFAGPATITIRASAATTVGTISRVDFYVGSTFIARDTTAPYSIGWTNVAAGTYVLKAVATSSAGASAESATATVTVTAPAPPPPATPPTVNLTGPANGQTFTAPATMTLSATASTTNGSITKVDFYSGTTLVGTDTTAPYSRSWANVAAGTYTLTAVVTDSAGLTTTSAPVTVVVNAAQVIPPTVTLTGPANGSAYNAPAIVTVSANATTTSGTIAKVDFYAGTTLIGSDTSSPYSITWSGAAAGTYVITARATGSNGATTTSAASTVTITPPLSAPTVSLTSPSTGATFTSPATITLSASATTASGTITRVDFYAGSTLIGSDTTSPYSLSWSGVAAGSYSLLAVATSSVGLTGQSSAISVTVASPATPPTVNLTAPASGATYTDPATVSLSASATTVTGTITSVSFYAGSTLLGTDTTSPYTFTWNNAAAGTYSLTVHATNSAGLTSTSSAVSIVVNAPAGGGGSTGGSGGGSGGGSSSGAVLDDFSQGLRTIPITGAIWSHYPEGATGSVTVSGGALVETVGASTNSSNGGVYLQFQPKDNDSYAFPGGYDQSHLVSGSWNSGFNRLTFRVKTSAAMAKPSNGGPNIEFGTYIRPKTQTDPNQQGAHYYHQLGVDFSANRWVYITINCVPQHQVGDNGTTNYGCNPTGDGYFDDLTRFYWDGIYGGGTNATWTYDDFQFAAVGGEPDTLVASVSAQYDGSKYKLSWATPKDQAVTYTVYYSTVSMHANGLSAGTNGGTTSSTGNTYTDGPNWQSSAMSQPGAGMFFAIQPSGSTSFTEVYVPVN